MGVKVELSKRSQELIVEYLSICRLNFSSLAQFKSPVDSVQLISWLSDEITTPRETVLESKHEAEFILASLRAELLRDLLVSMDHNNSQSNNTEENVSSTVRLKFALLALAGTLLAGCEGFDSITTMLSVLSLPSLITLIAGLSFSILSIVVFYSCDLVQVSKNLGISLIDAPKLLDVYLLQMNQIKSIRKIIDTYKLAELSEKELIHLQSIIVMLQKRFKALVESSSEFDKSINSGQMQATKIIVSGLAGLLFFGSGFFAGQSVGMFVASLFYTVVLPTFWPVVLFSVVVGLAALSLYWYVELVGLKNLVSGWFGLDEEKIDKLCDKSILEKEEIKLENLKEKVISTAKLKSQLMKFQHEFKNISELECKQNENPAIKDYDPDRLKTSSNIYSFHSAKVESQKSFSLEIPDSDQGLLSLSLR